MSNFNPNRHPEGAAGSMGGKFAPDPNGAQQAPVALGAMPNNPDEAAKAAVQSYARELRNRWPDAARFMLVDGEDKTGRPTLTLWRATDASNNELWHAHDDDTAFDEVRQQIEAATPTHEPDDEEGAAGFATGAIDFPDSLHEEAILYDVDVVLNSGSNKDR